jgi:hypothetical protein
MFTHRNNLHLYPHERCFMDRDNPSSYRGPFSDCGPIPASLPPRYSAAMPAQSIVPWTLGRVTVAGIGWLMAETGQVELSPVSISKRRV